MTDLDFTGERQSWTFLDHFSPQVAAVVELYCRGLSLLGQEAVKLKLLHHRIMNAKKQCRDEVSFT